MENRTYSATHPLEGAAAVVAKVATKDFGQTALQYLSTAARIDNFGAYYIPDLARPRLVLSIWSGRISDYWFQKNADALLGDPDINRQKVAQIRNAPRDGVHIDRWHPPENDPRRQVFDRAKIIERVAVFSRDEGSGFESFYLRGAADGWMTDTQYDDLTRLVPIVHELVALRHQIIGAENLQFTAQQRASSLKERNVTGFAALSQREAEVCDQLLDGRSVAGTAVELNLSETTVRTFRQRAYRKLGVGSATELMALFLDSR